MRTSELQIAEPHPFYKTYIDILGDAELTDMLQQQFENFPEFIESIPDAKWDYSYAPEKWTVAQALLHVIDSERIFQHRAFRFSRGDTSPLPGFDQDDYADKSKADRRSKESLIEEYRIVRKSTISLFANLDRDDLEKTGMASNMEWSVCALGFVICGHQKYHRNIIRERYL
ncbi:MAG: DinB family protein [Pricia sp.]